MRRSESAVFAEDPAPLGSAWPAFVERRRPRTRQRMDPLGTLSGWPLLPVASVFVVGYAAIATASHGDQLVHVDLAVLAVFTMAGAFIVFLAGAAPSHAPLRGSLLVFVVALAAFSFGLEMASTFGSNRLFQDDYGPVATGVILAMMASYRPAIQIAVAAVAFATIATGCAVVGAPYFAIIAPVSEYIVVGVVPILGLGLAGVAYAEHSVRAVEAWQRSAARATLARDREMREGIARSVQQEQVTLLGRDVLPFLAAIVRAGSITEAETALARSLARTVRGSLVAELEHTWLDEIVDRERARARVRDVSPPPVVTDPLHLAARMRGEQRAACAAILAELCASVVIGASGVTIGIEAGTLQRSGFTPHTVRVVATVTGASRSVRRALRPYTSVLCAVFVRVSATTQDGRLTVAFDYEV
ncbi:hypothetical protein [Luethyella okanaganae]|uniref:Integral membrane protein n=1 Tax=Luethyella okanaganae TaxID=69372 RepID=A0ABW1VCY1_9MICO